MNIVGPQGARGRRHETDSRHYGHLQPYANEQDASQPENNGNQYIRREYDVLSEQYKRALAELKHYQTKFQSAFVDSSDGLDFDAPPWFSAPEIISPLMLSYDSRIKELEDIVARQSSSLKGTQELVQLLTSDNEQLRHSLLDGIYTASANNAPLHGSPELLQELSDRLDILMAENALLLEQKVAMSTELDDHHSELEKLTADYSLCTENNTLAMKSVQQLKAIVAQLQRDRDSAAEQAILYSEALSKADVEIEALQLDKQKLVETIDDHGSQIPALKQTIKNLEIRIADTDSTAVSRMKVLEARTRELQLALQRKTKDFEELQDAYKKLKREYQSTRSDAEGMLQVMNGLEKQLSDFSVREEQLEQTTQDYRIKLEDVTSARDQLRFKEQYLQGEVDRLMDERKIYSQKYQAHLDEAVQVVQRKVSAITQNFESDTDNLAKLVADLRIVAEKATHECRSYKEQYEALAKLIDEERNMFNLKWRDLHKGHTEVCIRLSEEMKRKTELQETNKELRSVIDKLRLSMDTNRSLARSSELKNEAIVEKLQTDARICKVALEEKDARLSELQASFDRQASESGRELNTLQSEHKAECDSLRQRLEEITSHASEVESLYNSQSSTIQSLVDQMKKKSNEHFANLESVLQKEIAKSNVLVKTNRELEIMNANSESEKTQLVLVLDEANHTISNLQRALGVAKSTFTDYTTEHHYTDPYIGDNDFQELASSLEY